jgi:hypothetical protein
VQLSRQVVFVLRTFEKLACHIHITPESLPVQNLVPSGLHNDAVMVCDGGECQRKHGTTRELIVAPWRANGLGWK